MGRRIARAAAIVVVVILGGGILGVALGAMSLAAGDGPEFPY